MRHEASGDTFLGNTSEESGIRVEQACNMSIYCKLTPRSKKALNELVALLCCGRQDCALMCSHLRSLRGELSQGNSWLCAAVVKCCSTAEQ